MTPLSHCLAEVKTFFFFSIGDLSNPTLDWPSLPLFFSSSLSLSLSHSRSLSHSLYISHSLSISLSFSSLSLSLSLSISLSFSLIHTQQINKKPLIVSSKKIRILIFSFPTGCHFALVRRNPLPDVKLLRLSCLSCLTFKLHTYESDMKTSQKMCNFNLIN